MNFDLTTKEGRKTTLKTFDKWGWTISPWLWIAKKAYDFFNLTDVIKAQQKAAVELIKAGKDKNVDKMSITLDQKAGLDFGADVQGIPIKCMLGKDGKMTIEVIYKNA